VTSFPAAVAIGWLTHPRVLIGCEHVTSRHALRFLYFSTFCTECTDLLVILLLGSTYVRYGYTVVELIEMQAPSIHIHTINFSGMYNELICLILDIFA